MESESLECPKCTSPDTFEDPYRPGEWWCRSCRTRFVPPKRASSSPPQVQNTSVKNKNIIIVNPPGAPGPSSAGTQRQTEFEKERNRYDELVAEIEELNGKNDTDSKRKLKVRKQDLKQTKKRLLAAYLSVRPDREAPIEQCRRNIQKWKHIAWGAFSVAAVIVIMLFSEQWPSLGQFIFYVGASIGGSYLAVSYFTESYLEQCEDEVLKDVISVIKQ